MISQSHASPLLPLPPPPSPRALTYFFFLSLIFRPPPPSPCHPPSLFPALVKRMPLEEMVLRVVCSASKRTCVNAGRACMPVFDVFNLSEFFRVVLFSSFEHELETSIYLYIFALGGGRGEGLGCFFIFCLFLFC